MAWAWVMAVVGEERISAVRDVSWFAAQHRNNCGDGARLSLIVGVGARPQNFDLLS